ncbi:Protein sidekick-1 [Chamberlinius hualienensis]
MKLIFLLLLINLLWKTTQGEVAAADDATCADRYYGNYCNQTCGHCKEPPKCDKIDGLCLYGCEGPNFKAPDCRDCSEGYFGENLCHGKCHCKNDEICHKTTGRCPGECADGYVGENCQTLTGKEPTVAISTPKIVTVNEPFKVQCTATGDPQPNINITYFHATLIDEEPIVHQNNQFVKSANLTAKYPYKEGISITCVATNKYGSVESKDDVYVVEPPLLTSDPWIDVTEATSITISWHKWDHDMDFGGHSSDVPDYMVVYRLVGQQNWKNAFDNWQEENTAIVNDLKPNSKYEIAIKCRRNKNEYGDGPIGPLIEVLTKTELNPFKSNRFSVAENEKDQASNETKSIVTGPVQNLNATQFNSTQLTVVWSAPAELAPTDAKLINYTAELYLLKLDSCLSIPKELANYSVQTTTKTECIFEVQPSSQYVVSIVGDAVGGKGNAVNLTVNTMSAAPSGTVQNLNVTEVEATTLTFKWDEVPCHMINGKLLYYNYSLVKVVDKQLSNILKTGNTSDSRLKFENLTPHANYSFCVSAVNSIDEGPAISIVQMTLEYIPPSLKDVPIINEINSTSINISWKKWTFGYDFGTNATVEHQYLLLYKLLNETNWKNSSNEWQKETVAVITNLTVNSSYYFAVQCKREDNKYGIGPIGPIVQGTTKSQLPFIFNQTTLNITLVTATSTSLTFKIYQSNLTNLESIYHINYSSNAETWKDVRVTGNIVTIKDLNPFTEYDFKVRINNSLDWTDWSAIQKFKTAVGLPEQPTNLRIVPKSPTVIVLTWGHPKVANGIIINYKVVVIPGKANGTDDVHFDDSLNSTVYYADNYSSILNFSEHELGVNYLAKVSGCTSFDCGLNATIQFCVGCRETTTTNTTTAKPGRRHDEIICVDPPPTPTLVNKNSTTLTVTLYAHDNKFFCTPNQYLVAVATLDLVKILNETKNYYEANATGELHWIAAGISNSNLSKGQSINFTIGDGQMYGGYYNGPLVENKTFTVLLKSEGEGFESNWSSPMTITEITASTGQEKVCKFGEISCILAVVIVTVIVIAILLAIGIIWHCRKKGKKNAKNEPDTVISFMQYSAVTDSVQSNA